METYATRGSGTRHISTRQIQEMKKNMKKVPIIKEKSDTYHHAEEVNADRILDTATTETREKRYTVMKPTTSHHLTRFQKIGHNIHLIRHFIFHK